MSVHSVGSVELHAQTKGKVESGVKYVRRNFLCGLQGREPDSMEDLNNQLRKWVWKVANQRVHGTTHEQVMARWDADQMSLLRIPLKWGTDSGASGAASERSDAG
jgi:hypothetical protein